MTAGNPPSASVDAPWWHDRHERGPDRGTTTKQSSQDRERVAKCAPGCRGGPALPGAMRYKRSPDRVDERQLPTKSAFLTFRMRKPLFGTVILERYRPCKINAEEAWRRCTPPAPWSAGSRTSPGSCGANEGSAHSVRAMPEYRRPDRGVAHLLDARGTDVHLSERHRRSEQRGSGLE
jgi:hypothetical protein